MITYETKEGKFSIEQEGQAEHQTEQPHSVKFSISQKGYYSAEVKVYAKTPEEALKQCCAIASKVEIIIKEKNLVRVD